MTAKYLRARKSRSGFALMLVLVFIVLFLAMLGVACRQTAAALRIETIRTLQIQRDEGTLHALAKGLALLETGVPPADPYLCGVDITTSIGVRSFTVTFTVEGEGLWSVRSKPTEEGEYPVPMPAMFLPVPP